MKIFAVFFLGMTLSSGAQGAMEYRPDAERPADRFVVGTVVSDSAASPSIGSPSVTTRDSEIGIEAAADPLSGGKVAPFDIAYDSRSMPGFEVGRSYLFAFSRDTCVGFLEMPDDAHVYSPRTGVVALDGFVRDRLGKPFPDIHGAGEPIVPGDASGGN